MPRRFVVLLLAGVVALTPLFVASRLPAAQAQDAVNPLTGLAVADPALLERRPMLVKVSNHGPIIRPQSGLSYADHVWEYQMEGFQITRYTAVFYGQTPPRVGSVRSTRLIDVDHLMPMYQGLLVTSGGSTNRGAPNTPPRIEERLRAADWARRVVSESWIGDASYGKPYLDRLLNIPRPGVPRYHRLFAFPAEIWALMTRKGLNQRPALGGLVFDANAPAGGQPTTEAYLDYPGVGPQSLWKYNAATGRWQSWVEDQTGRRPVRAANVDYLTGQAPEFDNVVFLFARNFEADFIEDEAVKLNSVGVDLLGEGVAVLLRGDQRYVGLWRRYGPDQLMQLYYPDGTAMPFKPGTIWYAVSDSGPHMAKVAFWPTP
ncbi:MAG: DUF3048 domain-containing protein [Anaerolineales bacterium]|nr:DUF3048 domain-containing protein [Anaerolineales bacterium]